MNDAVNITQTDAGNVFEQPNSPHPTPPPPSKKVKTPWKDWPPFQRTLVITLAAISLIGLTGTATTTALAVHNFQNWELARDEVLDQRTRIHDLNGEVASSEAAVAAAKADLVPQQKMSERETAVTQRETAAGTREAEVQAREAAITAKEQHLVATSLTGGKYTVGLSMEAGTYRTENTNSRCYWAIYTSGTNYDDIVQNDLGSVGVLTVTIGEGQDFETSKCGTWTKVG